MPTIALFVEDWFEDLEFWFPYYRLKEEGFAIQVVGPEKRTFRGKKGLTARADLSIEQCAVQDFDGLLIPGGYAPDRMRRNSQMVQFVREMDAAHKPVAAICHGGWLLISAGIVAGRKLTSFFSIRVDLENAGAIWLDEPVVTDGNLITSRHPDDLPWFCRALIAQLKKEEP